MILTTVIGAMTLAALGPNTANHYYAKDQVRAPEIIEIRAGMINDAQTRRGQIRFSNETRGKVVAVTGEDGSLNWNAKSDREKLGGEDAPALIYVQIFDGIFAIDPFMPIPAANDSTAQMLFRGTTLETDRTQHGRQQIDRTKELFSKLEQARHDWLRDNGFYGVRVFTNPKADTTSENQAQGKSLPEPSAVFERPVDIPRGKSREQVKRNEQTKMQGVAMMLNDSESVVRISLPHNVNAQIAARVEKRNEANAEKKSDQVASNK
ncbi:MAG: hypothetical protein P1U42_02165 [Phycisphaerales bacterium]|nr:hypothetical protein [Phycisphaerales bacterium]